MARSRDTDVLHRGEGAPDGATPLGRPIYTSSTFVFANVAAVEAYQRGETRHYLYARWGNPSVEAVEEKLAALEGAEAGLVTASGMAAATTALFGLLSPGDEVLCGAALYGGTLHLITGALRRFGITARVLSLDELADVSRAIGPATKLVWFESPANPTLRCVDIRQVADACRARGVLVDDTGLRMRRISERLAEQAFGRSGIAQAREHEVDRGTGGIDGSVEVAPATLDMNVGLIDTPGLVGWLEMTAQPLLQFGTVALDPAPDGRVVRFQAALAEQLFDIAERERIPKVPAHGAQNQLGLSLSPLEDRRSDCLLHDLFRLPAAVGQSCNTTDRPAAVRSRPVRPAAAPARTAR